MPTPFMHLLITHQLAQDEQVPIAYRDLFTTYRPAWLLGGVVADQKAHDGADRSVTHFYRYDRPMDDNPWRIMLDKNPKMKQPNSDAYLAFVAGYVAHLACDEYWTRNVLRFHFAQASWGRDLRWRFFILHFMLTWMDQRDESLLPNDAPSQIRQCEPNAWIPFMSDDRIIEWRDFISEQIEGDSQTISIFAQRVGIPAEDFHNKLTDETWMQKNLWQHLPLTLIQQHEEKMYQFAHEQLNIFMDGRL